ncbi:hypothetical protein EST38_g5821 [Candolleomyces aberdarensis]|uniref:TrmE-type G domain-containing protein n=1 Tax=Candolleomyces aberdarensis TaxID=2316362 RepID=A0A4Q2DJ45_9AGAR|nr:hypothetical protein EST38_g5821 [Candolleomyces aberdarensis]
MTWVGKLREPTPWKLQRCRIVHPESGETIDDGLVVHFKGPKSFTSEDVVELHIHSGRAVISATLSALSKLPTFRPAEPGEFTRQTEGQRRVAVRAAEGATKQKFDELRAGIISALAKVEALIDFGEGEEIEEGVYEDAKSRAQKVLDTIQGYLNDHRRGELLRSGIRLAIFGPPNAGKSSLLNFLAQREAAIVTPIPGTTRDILELSLDLGGLPVVLADTAGLRKTEDVVERIGIERARKAVESADISICVLSFPEVVQQQQQRNGLDSAASSHWRELISRDNTFFLFNKSDLVDSSPMPSPPLPSDVETLRLSLLPSEPRQEGDIADRDLTIAPKLDALPPAAMTVKAWKVSLATGDGTEEFLEGFAEVLRKRFGMDDILSDAASPVITRSRHRDHLQSAKMHLETFLEYGPDDVVFAAEELRYAANAIGKVTGAIGVEDILDAVFRDFCIGK